MHEQFRCYHTAWLKAKRIEVEGIKREGKNTHIGGKRRRNYVPKFDVVKALHGESIGLGVLPDEALASHETQGTDSRALLGRLLQPHAEPRAVALVHNQPLLVVAVRDRQSDAGVSLQGVEERVGDPPSHRPRRFIQPDPLDIPPSLPASLPPPSLTHSINQLISINPASALMLPALPANRRYLLANHEC